MSMFDLEKCLNCGENYKGMNPFVCNSCDQKRRKQMSKFDLQKEAEEFAYQVGPVMVNCTTCGDSWSAQNVCDAAKYFYTLGLEHGREQTLDEVESELKKIKTISCNQDVFSGLQILQTVNKLKEIK